MKSFGFAVVAAALVLFETTYRIQVVSVLGAFAFAFAVTGRSAIAQARVEGYLAPLPA